MHIQIHRDVDMDVDSDMAVSISLGGGVLFCGLFGSFKGVVGVDIRQV